MQHPAPMGLCASKRTTARATPSVQIPQCVPVPVSMHVQARYPTGKTCSARLAVGCRELNASRPGGAGWPGVGLRTTPEAVGSPYLPLHTHHLDVLAVLRWLSYYF